MKLVIKTKVAPMKQKLWSKQPLKLKVRVSHIFLLKVKVEVKYLQGPFLAEWFSKFYAGNLTNKGLVLLF